MISAEAAIADIAELLVSEGSRDRVLEQVADSLAQLVPHDTLTIYIADPSKRTLDPVLVRDTYSDEILAMGPLAYGQGIVGSVAEVRKARMVDDVLADPIAQHIAGTPDEHEALVAIPLLARDELKGVLALYRLGEGNVFELSEFSLAIRFANLVALAIDNADIRARLRIEAVTDHLTGLYNHRYFQERLAEEVSRAIRLHSAVSLVMLDIDDFKWINDSHGHLIGDAVLKGLADICRRTCRAEDPVCRIGGEEFAVILPSQTLDEARGLGERLRLEVAGSVLPGGSTITISLGVGEAPRQASGARELYACADAALLAAKRAGKDRVVPCHPAIHPLRGQGTAIGVTADDSVGRSDETDLGEVRSLAQMRMLHKLTSHLVQLREETSIAEAITADLRGLIDYHNCRIYLLQDDGRTLAPVWFRGEFSEYQGETYEALLVEVGEGITGRCVERDETILLENAIDCEFALQIPGTPDIDESMLSVPLRYGERVIGAIVLSKLGVGQFDQDDQRLLEVLAGNAATAFENARLARAQADAARRLEHAYLSTVEALANALEAKDAYTGDHARALAEMAIAIGREFGIEGDRLKMLELAALFHDIGKIGVASEIIRKPGPLSPAERREMERHPDIGAQILEPVPFLQPIRPIIRACHERWDGLGYPGRLSGESIPLEARIILVCDAYHAMTTDRPYRRALPPGEPERRLLEAAGKQFDPLVVRRFLTLLEEERIRSPRRPGPRAVANEA